MKESAVRITERVLCARQLLEDLGIHRDEVAALKVCE
jgi:hypothetical protein